ncbi:hypothetical protein ACFZDG_23400 [Kitasatospora xanthocidica]|uniref:hypothetical protein n=1 Tax=Kitasatospora xanthocidica TaxID=83382 RepID=UPI0036E7F6A1
MTEHQVDSAPTADSATAYLEGLRERLAADGCQVAEGSWHGLRAVVGSRSDRKARWFGTEVDLFVLAAAVHRVDEATLAEFTSWAMAHAGSVRTGPAGARNAAMILPALIGDSVHPAAAQWAGADGRVLGATLIARPVAVEAAAPGAARVTMYRGGFTWGGMFTSHVLEKAALYFP